MTKKHSSSLRLKKSSNQILKSLSKLNGLNNSTISDLDDSLNNPEIQQISEQITNCSQVLRFLKKHRRNIIQAKQKLPNDQAHEREKKSEASATISEKDFNTSEMNSTSPTQPTANSLHRLNQLKITDGSIKKVKKIKRRQKRLKPVTIEAQETREANKKNDCSYYEGIGNEYDLGNLINTKEIVKKNKISAGDQLLLIYQLTYKGCDSKLGSTDFWREVFKTYRKCFDNLSMSSVIRHWYQIRSYGNYNEFIGLIHKFKHVLETYDLR